MHPLLFDMPSAAAPKKTRNRNPRETPASPIRQAPLALDLPAEDRLPLPSLTEAEVRALPDLPGWLPAWRANEAMVEAVPLALGLLYPILQTYAGKWEPRRRCTTKDDILSGLTAACRRELAGWDIARKQKPLKCALAFSRQKLANRSIERDWMPAPMQEGLTDGYMVEVGGGDAVSVLDCLADESQDVAGDVIRKTQAAAVIEVLRRDRSDLSKAAEILIARECGLSGRTRRITPDKKSLKIIAAAAGKHGRELELIEALIIEAGQAVGRMDDGGAARMMAKGAGLTGKKFSALKDLARKAGLPVD